jgi:uncharacterized protein YjbI with pentapeptide repeats
MGATATLVLTLTIVLTLQASGGAEAVSRNAIPIGGLLISGAVFTSQMVNSALEDQRAREARELEAQRAQEAALQAFLDQLSQGDTFSELRSAPAIGHKRAILRAKMQTLLLQLDEERKGVVLSFLHSAKLSRKKEITPYEYTGKGGWERWNYPILTLDEIDFSRTKRNPGTKLTFDDLRGIILRGATLSKVNLSGANLMNADLSNADLRGAQLRKATPQDSERIPGESHDEYYKAVDKESNLPLGLLETDLSRANLSGADLREADLSGADLSGADLSEAVGITSEELEQQTKFLEDATMPNGLSYKDWLKSKGQQVS